MKISPTNVVSKEAGEVILPICQIRCYFQFHMKNNGPLPQCKLFYWLYRYICVRVCVCNIIREDTSLCFFLTVWTKLQPQAVDKLPCSISLTSLGCYQDCNSCTYNCRLPSIACAIFSLHPRVGWICTHTHILVRGFNRGYECLLLKNIFFLVLINLLIEMKINWI